VHTTASVGCARVGEVSTGSEYLGKRESGLINGSVHIGDREERSKVQTWKKVAVLMGTATLVFAMFGIALAATGASDQGVTPTLHDGANITTDGGGNTDAADCDAADVVSTGDQAGDTDASGSVESTNGVTVNWTYDSDSKAVSFTVDGGLVTIAYIKGGNAYNEYDYSAPGVDSDGNLFAPDNASNGPAGLSHAIFCTGPAPVESPSFDQSQEAATDVPSTPPTEAPSTAPSFDQSQSPATEAPSFEQTEAAESQPNTATIGSAGTSGPSDGSWLLVAAVGVLLASVIVLTPARAKNKR
jgi:hypothetical protein